MHIRQMKSKEISDTRERILKEQNGKCALCPEIITEDSGSSLDHQHKFQRETNGEDGAGLIRGVLCRACNVWEGKIWNNTGRYRQPKSVLDRIEMLVDLIEYYYKDNYPLIHPSEKIKELKVSKRNYNKLKKVYKLKRKFPDYPKSGKLSKPMGILFELYGIPPYN